MDVVPDPSGTSSQAVPIRRHIARDTAIALSILGLTAFSTFHGITTDRWTHDLAITQSLQKLNVGSFDGILFWMGVRGVAGFIMAATAIWLWVKRHHVAAAMIVLMLIPDASSFILRDIFERPRPTVDAVIVKGGPQGFSFPSGTALHTIFFYGFMLYLLPRITNSKRLVWAIGTCLGFWILFQGAWLIHHGRHWTSDVVGGYLYGAVYLTAWVKLYPKFFSWHARNPHIPIETVFRLRRSLAKIGIGTDPSSRIPDKFYDLPEER